MAKIAVADWIKRLKHLETNRVTYYDNSFPGNSGEINPDGSISFDCIGMVKAVINDPDIVYKTSPAGYHAPIGKVIGDLTEQGILNECAEAGSNFNRLTPGEYLCMFHRIGHAGVYVGDFTDPSGVVNTIECTTDMNGGVTTSYCDTYGNRWNHKGGYKLPSAWEYHGKLSKYIDYGAQPAPAPAPAPSASVEFTYQVWDDLNNLWEPNVINGNDYAGIFGSDVCCVYASCSNGDVRYAVHTWKGDQYEQYPDGTWLPEVTNREDYAGVYNRPIDGFILKSSKHAKYRVHLRKSKQWLEWVKTAEAAYGDPEHGFAGIIGEPIDAIQIAPM